VETEQTKKNEMAINSNPANAAANSITTVFFSMGLASLAASLSRVPRITWPHFAFVGFFVAFRLKMYLDDLKFLAGSTQRDGWFKTGFVVGVVSWFFWIVAAMNLTELRDTLLPMLIAVSLDTLWVAIEGFKSHWRESHLHWLIINLIYVGSLGISRFVWRPTPGTMGIIFILFVVIQIFDFAASKSLSALD